MTTSPRHQVRALLERLAGTATFTDAQDVFATSIVRSMNLLELICGIEDLFGLEVSQRDVYDGRLASVDAMVAFVGERRPELAEVAS